MAILQEQYSRGSRWQNDARPAPLPPALPFGAGTGSGDTADEPLSVMKGLTA